MAAFGSVSDTGGGAVAGVVPRASRGAGLEIVHGIAVDRSRDALLTDFGKAMMTSDYLLPGESFQDRFACVARAFADDDAHAQRIYDAISKLWLMPATPVLSNGGTTRGLPISCYLSTCKDSLESIVDHWNENVWLAAKGGGIGCVDADTEYLTKRGWKRIAEYQEGEEILVVSEDGETGFFEKPLGHVRGPAGKMTRFHGECSDMVVSDDHRHLVRFDGKSGFNIHTTGFLLENDRYRQARFKPAVISEGGKGLPYAPLELMFLVALAADGNETNDRDIRFAFKRHRKIERMRWLLAQLGLDHTEKECSHSTLFHLYDPGLRKLALNFENFGEANASQLKIIFDELGYWDGSFDLRNSNLGFSTMRADEADFVQYVMWAVTGHRSGMGIKARDGEIVVRQTRDFVTMFARADEFTPADGVQYCFRTRTGLWMSRRNGKPLVTGNSYWGNLRGLGEKVGLNGKTSGIIPFIRVMDSLTLAVSQGSLRRGSAAVYLPVSHPEIEEFVEIRRPTGGDPNRKALNLHNAVVVPDAFMRAVESGGAWELRSPKDGKVTKTVSARDLWIRILTARIETGEPYILYGDTTNRAIPEHHRRSGLKVVQSNLCSEVTLPTGVDHHGKERTAVCCLSSLNLDRWAEWRDDPRLVEDVLRFLDNVLQHYIDTAPDTMARARYSAMRERSVGLGVMGFHSLLQREMIPFESPMARALNKRIFRVLRQQADAASRLLAEERGACPDAAEHGVMERFSNKIAIAPTASISVICGQTSPGIEPYAANAYNEKRKIGSFPVRNAALAALLAGLGRDDEATWSSIVTSKGSVQHLPFLSDIQKAVFRTAFEIDQTAIIDMAADRAPFVCQSQSLNIFLPADVHKKTLHDLHFRAWKGGVKSLYYCRSLSIQRAQTVSDASGGAGTTGAAATFASAQGAAGGETNKYEVCEACQ